MILSKVNVFAPPGAGKSWWVRTLRASGFHCADTDEMLCDIRQPGFSTFDHDKWRFVPPTDITCDIMVTNMFKLPELTALRGWKVLVLPIWWSGIATALDRLPHVDEVVLTPFHVAQAATSSRLLERFVLNTMSKDSPNNGLVERALGKVKAPGIYAVKISETVTFRKRFTIITQQGLSLRVKFLKFEQANACAYFEVSVA